MFTAGELKEGMVMRIEGEIYRVLEAESKAGTAKLGGVVKTKLSNVRSGHVWEPHFRPQERLEELQLERRMLEFVFAAGDTLTFMSPQTFEQFEVPRARSDQWRGSCDRECHCPWSSLRVSHSVWPSQKWPRSELPRRRHRRMHNRKRPGKRQGLRTA